MARRYFGETLKPRREIGVFAGLHEAEMALRQHERLVARDRAQHRNAEARSIASATAPRWRSLPSLLSTTPPITNLRSCTRQSPRRPPPPIATARTRRARAAPAGRRRAARSAAAPERPGVPGTPSNSPIAPSITSTSAPCVVSAISASSSAGGIAQLSRLTPLRAGRRGMKRGIDVVGPGLRRPHRDALAGAARRAGRA